MIVMMMVRVVSMTMVVPMVMAVPMPRRISPALRLKRRVQRLHLQMRLGAQHVGQHMVGLDLQIAGLQLDGHMAVAQVIGRAGQVKGRTVPRASADAQQRLGCRLDADQAAILGQQHIAAAQQGASRQEHTKARPLESSA